MTELTIKTNNQPRSLFNPCELSQSQRAKLRRQFDWMGDEQFDHNCSFFLYRGWYYNLCDFLTNLTLTVCLRVGTVSLATLISQER
jgi:hypothetical protein